MSLIPYLIQSIQDTIIDYVRKYIYYGSENSLEPM
jgi:hypothetical protein